MTDPKLLDTASAVEQLRAGKVIAYPTEAVYGLGCDPRNEAAAREILALKGRHAKAGFVLIASRYSQIQPWIADIDKALVERAMSAWPGPVTWLFPRAAQVPDFIAGNHPTVALRITAHEPSRALCDAFGSALVSTSANPSTREPARSAAQVAVYFGDRIAGILAGRLGDSANPSEIRDLVSGNLIRRG
ncbi:MAG: Sua5/YciO/YrdC/YwlC family protein [Lysobacterales bacterium]|jgi:L-threonylcarbamoyladenylate synthase